MIVLKPLFIFAHICLLMNFSSCNGQADNDKIYNKKYVTGTVSGFDEHLNLSHFQVGTSSRDKEREVRMDSLRAADTTGMMTELLDKMDFRKNRSRIFIKFYSNGEADTTFNIGVPTGCECTTRNDSLQILFRIGNFSNFGFNLLVTGGEFVSEYYSYSDDTKPYKASLSDNEFSDFVSVRSEYQYLVLDQEPIYKAGQQISGYLSFTSGTYYEEKMDADNPDSNFVSSKIYFSCLTRKVKEGRK
jgi:hypothetical protein